MSILRNKSDFNLEAAKVLIDEHQLYAPSVNCSYYSCFQFIRFKLNALGKTYADVDQEIASDTRRSSHKYPISLLVAKLKESVKDDNDYFRKVNDKIGLLKLMREEADYDPQKEIGNEKAKGALDLSTEVIAMINKKL